MKTILLILTGSLSAFFSCAQLKLPGIFGDHMVIQRSQPAPVWGWATPGEKIVVMLNKQSKEAITDRNGQWRTNLDSEPAGGPFEMIVRGAKETIRFQDVMLGEVWLCSGQSNMEFELKKVIHANMEISAAEYPEIRHIKIPNSVSQSPKDDIRIAAWQICTPEKAGEFTAVGYFFAREIVKRLHVSVGLINATWGGTMVETWTSRGAFEKSPEFRAMIAAVGDKDVESLAKQKRFLLEKQIKTFQKMVPDSIPETEWQNPDYSSASWPKISVSKIWENQALGLEDLDGIVWFRREIMMDSTESNEAATITLGKIDDNDITYLNGVRIGATNSYSDDRVYPVPSGILKPGRNILAVRVDDTGGGGGFYGDSTQIYLRTGNRNTFLGNNWRFRIAKMSGSVAGFGPNDYPTLLYNAMIHPLIPFGIRGVLWYQGEANTGRAYQYRTAFPLMINDWRSKWGEGNFPFYFVQLASFNAANGNSEKGSDWAELREAQTFSLGTSATGMAVTTDIGEPNDIHPKNKQTVGLRLAAIALNNIYSQPMEYSGPVYESIAAEGNKMILRFSHTGSGLMVKDKYGYLKGFEIAGSDHHFHYAKAYIENNKIVVYSDDVAQPVSVHYAWSDDAGDANLYNQEGFPAVPFRTDQWTGITDNVRYEIGK